MKYIIITSIFDPTEAVRKFSSLKDYKLIVVGDLKTPAEWYSDNTVFLSVNNQKELPFGLLKLMPYNHYCRKMIGYLAAISEGANFIIDTDDDNIPKDNWSFPVNVGMFEALKEDQGFINIYNFYSKDKIWPRGLPLRLINNLNQANEILLEKKQLNVGIWQGLADEDPDVDAIYRLTSDKMVKFSEREPLVLSKGTITPFNSQNTAFVKDLFPLLYLPCYVTFRFTDILRGLIAQPIMWLYEYNLGFTNATVIQKRNPHDYTKDFVSEIPMYLYTDKVVEIVVRTAKSSDSLTDNLYNSYEVLVAEGIVPSEELPILETWLKDLSNIKI